MSAWNTTLHGMCWVFLKGDYFNINLKSIKLLNSFKSILIRKLYLPIYILRIRLSH